MKRKIVRYRLLLLFKIHDFLYNISHRVANRYTKLYAKTIYMWEENQNGK